MVAALPALLLSSLPRTAHADTLMAQAGWPPPFAQPMAPIAGPRVLLQVDNPNARLQQHGPLKWQDVCVAPCAMTVDPGGLYRVGGGTSIASAPFSLPRPSGDIHVDAHVGSKVKHWTGLGLMIGGGVAALYGLLYWQMSSAFRDYESSNGMTSFSDSVRNIGLTAIGVGVVLEIVGIVMFSDGTSVAVR